MDNFRESYHHSIVDEVWITLPSFIEWLKNKRSETNHYYSINLTILFHSTCIIEGFLFQLLTDNCGLPCENETMEDRLQIDLFKKLESASWLQYVEFFQLISGKKLSEQTDNETWEAITVLFQLRNQLTHGKYLELNFQTLERSEPLINGKYAHIYTYYKEVGLIDPKREDFVPGIVSFVTSESADFFYLKTKKLLEDILTGYPDENWLGPVKEAYDLAFEVELYYAILGMLIETRKVIAIELQGHGRTPLSDRKFSLPALAHDVESIMDYLKVDNADMVEYSMDDSVDLNIIKLL